MQANVGEVSTASVACGVLGVGGNKGGVAVSFTLYRRRLCCVSSHFAAHQVSIHLSLLTCSVQHQSRFATSCLTDQLHLAHDSQLCLFY